MHKSTVKGLLIEEIEQAFADARLDDGVTIHEAEVLDIGPFDETHTAAREKARQLHVWAAWSDIPDKEIGDHPDVLTFLDDKGFRFHIPAFMRFSLRHLDDDEDRWNIAFSTCSSLNASGELRKDKLATFGRLTHAQRAVIAKFLYAMSGEPDYREVAEEALTTYWKQYL